MAFAKDKTSKRKKSQCVKFEQLVLIVFQIILLLLLLKKNNIVPNLIYSYRAIFYKILQLQE